MARDSNTRRNRAPGFVFVECVVSAIVFGAICWNSTLRSHAEPTTRDYLFLLLYEFLSLVSYIAAFRFFKRLSSFRGSEVLVVLFLISVSGTILPYVASSIQIWAEHSLQLGLFLRQSAVGWLMLNLGIFLLLGVTSVFGFLLTLPFRKRAPKAADI